MRIAITGADGSGKSTLISKFSKSFSCLRFPLDLPANDPLYPINQIILKLAREADRERCIGKKAISLFAAMRLTGHHIASLSNSFEHILTERDCYVDSLVYGHLYRSELSASKSLDVKFNSITAQELELFLEWMRQSPNLLNVFTLEQLLLTLLNLFADNRLLQKLMHEYQCTLADHIVYLAAPPTVLMKRIALRASQLNIDCEYHETAEHIASLQRSYDFVLSSLEQQGLTITRIDSLNHDPENLLQFLLPQPPPTLRVENHAVHR